MARIHPSAVVDPGARLDSDVSVGPLCYVGADVEIGQGSELVAQVTVLGPATLGRNNRMFPQAVLGAEPQDRTYRGETTSLVIGDENVFREHVTVHRGTLKGGGVTRIGDRCLLMVGAHVAHDCLVADSVVLTNQCALGGHVQVGRSAVCGGMAAVAPFVRLGTACFLAGGAMVERDVPPFVIAAGDRARVRALNRVGLERLGVPMASQRALQQVFTALWRDRAGRTFGEALATLAPELLADPHVAELVAFLRSDPSRT